MIGTENHKHKVTPNNNFCIIHRPIAGHVNFCPNQLTSDSDDDEILAVAKHEILHALVGTIKPYMNVQLL